tara:strand:+ start:386 stop:1204 length:819 start_codon:yes stop_codon:yes gene_type:complete
MSPIQQLLLGTGASAATAYVTDNLVFHLDAADTNCYSGSGTTVNSLVNSHTNDNWGGMQWSSDSGGNTGGYFYVDGTQSSGLQFPYSTDFEMLNDGTNAITAYTWEWWWYGDSSPASGGSVAGYIAFTRVTNTGKVSNSDLSALGGSYFPYRLSSGRERMIVKGASTSNTSFDSGHTWSGSRWMHHVITRSGNNLKLYIDNASAISKNTTFSGSNNFSNSKKLNLLSYYISSNGSDNKFDGRLGVMRFYQGKTLTASEVEQNYNAEKSRYGH